MLSLFVFLIPVVVVFKFFAVLVQFFVIAFLSCCQSFMCHCAKVSFKVRESSPEPPPRLEKAVGRSGRGQLEPLYGWRLPGPSFFGFGMVLGLVGLPEKYYIGGSRQGRKKWVKPQIPNLKPPNPKTQNH